MRRIDFRAPDGPASLDRLRAELGNSGNVVSPKGQALTQKVFGAPLTPTQVVERVCQDVRDRGRDALFHYTEQFDRVTLTPGTLRLNADELHAAHVAADPDLMETVRRVRSNVMAFQTRILHKDAALSVFGGLLRLR
jgi:histidinol dehydrogenase